MTKHEQDAVYVSFIVPSSVEGCSGDLPPSAVHSSSGLADNMDAGVFCGPVTPPAVNYSLPELTDFDNSAVISEAWPLPSMVSDQGQFDNTPVETVLSPSVLRSSTQAEFDINNNACSDVIIDMKQMEDRGGDPSPSPVSLSLSSSATVGQQTAETEDHSGSTAALSGDEQACGGAAPTAEPSPPPP